MKHLVLLKKHALFLLLLVLAISAHAQAPTIYYASTQNVFTVGTAITPLTPTITGTVTSFNVNPNLPKGLSIDANGVISGTPKETANAIYQVVAKNGTDKGKTSISITIYASATWTGNKGTDWTDPKNWSPKTVPNYLTDITIPAVTNQPVLTTAQDSVHNITIASGIASPLTVNGNGVLVITGSVSNTSGSAINATAGTVSFWGDLINLSQAQTSAGDITTGTLVIGSTGGVVLSSGTVRVLNIYKPLSGVLTTNGHLVLASTSAGSAIVLPGSGTYVTGAVTIERYIPAQRAWRLLTAPLSNTGSIYANWQNNGQVISSRGAEIWSPAGTGGMIKGGNIASIERYDPLADAWIDLANTNNTALGSNNTAAANNAYSMFITGPYGSGNIAPAKGAAATTLVATGQLQTGTQTFTYVSATHNYILVGNPYAAPVDFTNLGRQNIKNTMWAWDPQRKNTSYGGFVTFSWDKVNKVYDQDIPATETHQTHFIQSGQAIMVQVKKKGTVPTVVFNESDKGNIADTVNAVFFAPTGGVTAKQIRVTLNRSAGAAASAIDGVLVKFGAEYGNDPEDNAEKVYDYDESLALTIDTDYYSIERRALPVKGDKLFLNVYGLKTNARYSFTIAPENLSDQPVKAVIIDNYLKTQTPVSLTDNTTVNFTTSTDVPSSAGNRFEIAFDEAGTLASTVVGIKAWQQPAGVQVEWAAATEQGVKQYQVEKSTDGQNFTTAGTFTPRNTGKTEVYDWVDVLPASGDNYYRVASIDQTAVPEYSKVATVKLLKGPAGINVYPNPVRAVNKQLNLQMNSMDAGAYTVMVYTNQGKKVAQKAIQHDGVTVTKTVGLPTALAAGSYRLVLVDAKGNQWKQQVVVQ